MNSNNDDDDSTPYVISNEHHLKILMEYLPRELDSIVRLSSKSFNRVIIDINNTNKSKIISGNQLVKYLIANGMVSLFEFAKESGCMFIGLTLCDTAALHGQLDCLNYLRAEGYPCYEDTMRKAAEGGHLHIMQHLYDESTNYDEDDTDEEDPKFYLYEGWPRDMCYYAARGGNIDCFNFTHHELSCENAGIDECADEHGSVAAAAERGHIQMVRMLLDAGAEPNAVDEENLSTPLILASREGHVDVVRELLDRGVDPNQDEDGENYERWVPLVEASRGGHVQVVRALLDGGADINLGNDDFNSLMIASRRGHIQVVRELLDRGAALNPVDIDDDEYERWTPLIEASEGGHLELVRELLKRGADVNDVDVNGWTALMVASREGHIEVVRQLLKCGADVNARLSSGDTPRSLASKSGHKEIARLLRRSK